MQTEISRFIANCPELAEAVISGQSKFLQVFESFREERLSELFSSSSIQDLEQLPMRANRRVKSGSCKQALYGGNTQPEIKHVLKPANLTSVKGRAIG